MASVVAAALTIEIDARAAGLCGTLSDWYARTCWVSRVGHGVGNLGSDENLAFVGDVGVSDTPRGRVLKNG